MIDTILEIIKITVPALTVFLTTWFILKEFFNAQYRQSLLDYKTKQTGITTPLKLQAYERLILFCERLHLPNLIMRASEDAKTAGELRFALLITIKNEWEFNFTQQLFVSPQLWQILLMARDNSSKIVELAYEGVDANAPSSLLIEKLNTLIDYQEKSGLDQAMQALREEAGLIL